MISTSNNKGFTIIEVIVALFILTISLFGFMQVSNYIIAKINTSDYRITAINYAGGGVEIVRGLRDNFLSQNLNYGWNNPETNEIDSFLELVSQSESGDYKIVPLIGQNIAMPSDEIEVADFQFNGYALEPIEPTENKENWELVFESGFTRFLRKIRVEDAQPENDNLKKVTVSVYFDDGTYYDTINISTYLGNLALDNEGIETN